MNKTFLMKELNGFLISFRESFVAMIPFLLFYSTCMMILQIMRVFSLESIIFSYDTYMNLNIKLQKLFPLLISMSISFHISRRHNINSYASMVSTFLILLAYQSLSGGDSTVLFPNTVTFYVILVPILSSYFYRVYGKYYIYTEKKMHDTTQISISFQYAFPLLYNFFFVMLTIFLIDSTLPIFTESLKESMSLLPIELFVFLKLLWSHILWFFGIHGSNIGVLLFDNEIFKTIYIDNLTNKNIYDLFIIIGGSGAGLSLAISILLYAKNKQWNNISKMAFPFLIFNINEILIYGLPIMLNRYLLIPFILVPSVNFALIYYVLSLDLIAFYDVSVHWTTPVFLNSYLYTNGNYLAMFIQFFLVILGVIIYYPFIKKYTEDTDLNFKEVKLKEKLNVIYALEAADNDGMDSEKRDVINKSYEVNKIIDVIGKNKLKLYYQPKINIKSNKCYSFEALMRIDIDGAIKGPYFIEELEDAGLCLVMDYWVCTKVKEDLDYLKNKYNFIPKISINLHPNTINNNESIDKIIELLDGYLVDFEILERASLDGKNCFNNINKMKQHNFRFAIDDFGTGHSSIQSLFNTYIDFIKIDKSLVDNLGTIKANLVFTSLCNLCNDLNLTIIVEGVETQEQYDIVKANGNIEYIQGFYFSKAIRLENIFQYSENFQNK